MPIHDCAHTTVTTWLCPHTFVLRHVCAQTRLYPHTFVPKHICADTRLCPHMLVPTHVCARTRLCPHTFVPRHVCAHTCLCPSTLVPQHELWPDTNMSLDDNNIIIVSTRLWLCQLDWWKHRAQTCLGTYVHVRSCLDTFVSIHDCDHTIIMSGHKKISGHKRVWPQTCVSTNVSGHKRVRAQSCLGTNVWSPSVAPIWVSRR